MKQSIKDWKNSSPFTTTYLLAGVFAILLIALILVKDPFHIRRTDRKTPLINAVSAQQVTKMERTTESDNVTDILTRTGDIWKVTSSENAPANVDEIENLLEALFNIERDEIASRTSDSHETFRVNEKGTRISLYTDDTKLTELVVGKNGPDFTSTYVRKEGEDIVYLHPQNLRPIVGVPDFRNLTILSIPQESITKIRGTDNNESAITIAKSAEGTWAVIEPLKVDLTEEKVSLVLSTVSDLSGTDIHMSLTPQETGLEDPYKVITISASDTEVSLKVGDTVPQTNPEGSDPYYYVSSSQNDNVYSLPATTVELLPTSLQDLD